MKTIPFVIHIVFRILIAILFLSGLASAEPVLKLENSSVQYRPSPLIEEVRLFIVQDRESGDKIASVRAQLNATLNHWSLNISLLGPTSRSLLEITTSAISQLPKDIRDARIYSVSINCNYDPRIATAYASVMNKALASMPGMSKPRSTALFVVIRDFIRNSPELRTLGKSLSQELSRPVISTLPANETSLSPRYVDRKWKDLTSAPDFGLTFPLGVLYVFSEKIVTSKEADLAH